MRMPPLNYTQTPNDLFDYWLPHLGEAELKVLMVIMRKTLGWHKVHDEISASQLSRITGLIEETVVRAAKSLQKRGIISREVVGPVGKQRVIYSLIMPEDSNISDPPDKTDPPDENPPDKNDPQKKLSTKEKTAATERKSAAAVSLDSRKKEIHRIPIYPILETVDIPLHDKEEITRDYTEADVAHGVAYALQPGRVIKTCLAAMIKWACKIKPAMTKSKEDIERENKDYAKKYEGKKSGSSQVVICRKYVEITTSAQCQSYCYAYHEADFMDKFKKALIKCKFSILE